MLDTISKIVGKKVKRNLEKGHRLKLQDIKYFDQEIKYSKIMFARN